MDSTNWKGKCSLISVIAIIIFAAFFYKVTRMVSKRERGSGEFVTDNDDTENVKEGIDLLHEIAVFPDQRMVHWKDIFLGVSIGAGISTFFITKMKQDPCWIDLFFAIFTGGILGGFMIQKYQGYHGPHRKHAKVADKVYEKLKLQLQERLYEKFEHEPLKSKYAIPWTIEY